MRALPWRSVPGPALAGSADAMAAAFGGRGCRRGRECGRRVGRKGRVFFVGSRYLALECQSPRIFPRLPWSKYKLNLGRSQFLV